MKKNFNSFSSFILKIIAIVSMTIDHIGVALATYYPSQRTLIFICRALGRLAMPLFAFMIVEGVLHTKNIKKYLLKLGIIAACIFVGQCVCFYVPSLGLAQAAYAGNVFLDLTLGALLIYILNNKNKYAKLVSIPIIAYSIFSFISKCFEAYRGINFVYLPPYLRMQYDWLSILMMIGFYFAYKFADIYWEQQSQYSGISLSVTKETNNYRISVNIIAAFVIFVSQLLFSLTYFICKDAVYWDFKIQLFSLVACVVIIFYSGKRGYDSKPFRWATYLYYPIHILIIFAIFYIVAGV